MNIKIKPYLQESIADKCFELFGNYLFGEWTSFYKRTIEKDTEYEELVWKHIKRFIQGEYTDTEKDKVLIDALQKLKKCTSVYPNILEPPKGTFYRGTKILKEALKEYELLDYDKDFSIIKDYHYKPKSIIQSWTTDFKIANETFGVSEGNYVGIVLMTKNNKNMLFNPKFLNTIHFKESESIRIGNELICDMLISK